MAENGSNKTRNGLVHVNNYVEPTSKHKQKDIKPKKRSSTPQIEIETKEKSNSQSQATATASGSGLLGAGLEASFASLRRSSATPDLAKRNGKASEVSAASHPNSAGSISTGSSPRLPRPPTVESKSVSIHESEVMIKFVVIEIS